MAKIFARIRRPSLRQGLLFGLMLGVIEIVYGFAITFAFTFLPSNIQYVLSSISLALFLLFGFLAGRWAAQETGRLGTGVLAGLWTGVIGSLVIGLVSLIGTLVNMSSIIATDQQIVRKSPQLYPGISPSDITVSYILTAFLIDLVISSLLFQTLLTLGGGTLGAFLGRRRALAQTDDGSGVVKVPASDEATP